MFTVIFLKLTLKNAIPVKFVLKNVRTIIFTSIKNGIPQWGRNCLFCLYCEMKCPKDAIKSPVDWLIMAPFMNYNILPRLIKTLQLTR